MQQIATDKMHTYCMPRITTDSAVLLTQVTVARYHYEAAKKYRSLSRNPCDCRCLWLSISSAHRPYSTAQAGYWGKLNAAPKYNNGLPNISSSPQ